MKCPRCGQEILDPDPSFCPRCGFVIPKAEAPPPTPDAVSAPEERDEPAVAQPQAVRATTPPGRYYLLAFLAVVGGIVGYRATKKQNPRVAATILTLGLLVTAVYAGAGYEVYSRATAPTGFYAMTITGVTFPNSTSVRVTISNQGTLEDGLESVALNNGTLWLVYGLVSPTSAQASSELQTGNLAFTLYGYILANGTTIPAAGESSAAVGTEGFPPSHTDQVTIRFIWTPLTSYKVFISTASRNPNQMSVVSPV
jgi:uncharacterized membrane protein (UPF0136 family)